MKAIRQLVLVLAVTLAFDGFAETDAEKPFVFKGVAVDAAGRPAEGATIECYGFETAMRFGGYDLKVTERAVAGTNGAFELKLPRTGAIVLVRKPGLAPAWRQFWNVRSDVEQRLVLTPPAVLAGTVMDETDKPVAGAEVFVSVGFTETELEGGGRTSSLLGGKPARECFNARTDASGRFRIEGFPTNASANLSVQSPGKTLRSAPQQYLGPDTMQCLAGQEDIRLVVEPAGSVEGKIVAEGGAPVPLARLSLQPEGPGFFGWEGSEPAESGADGAFRIADVAAGSYRVRAVFGTNAVPDWVAETVPVVVDEGQTTRGLEIFAMRGGLLEAVVRDKSDGKPLAQVSVNTYRQGYQTAATTGKDGRAVLRLPVGDYQLAAYRPGVVPENRSATVETGKTNRVEFELAGPAKLRGIVLRPDSQPAAGLTVRVVGAFSPDEGKAKTDTAGKFEMEWNPQRFGRSDMAYCVLIRDVERNLAVAQDIDEETGPLELRLSPAMTIVGRAECQGKPVTNAIATLVFWSGNSGMHLQGLCTATNEPGHFEIPALPPDRRYGLQVSARGYGQKSVNTVESEAAKRVEIDPVELKPANARLAGQVVDAEDKPAAGAYVNLYGEGQPSANARTDRNGRFSFEHVCEGPAQLSANARNSHGSVSAEGGETNVVLKLGETYSAYAGSAQRKLKGIVTDPEGKPAAGVQVAVFPFFNSRWIKTGTNGAFNLTFVIQPWQAQSGGEPCLVVRDLARNLAAAEDISEEATNLDVRLKPALVLTGRVEGPDGSPLTNAQVGVWLEAARSYSQVSEQLAGTDAQGRFEIKTLPVGPKYIVFAKAKDHGRHQEALSADAETNRVELEPFVLKVANQIVVGQVLNEKDKPVTGANVSLSGDDQPEGSATTDNKGRFSFKVCDGQVRLFASSPSGYANATVEAGDTNVIIALQPNQSVATRYGLGGGSSPRRSLRGSPLPDLTAVGLATNALPSGQPLLLCLFDLEQRPSRRCVRLLGEQRDALKQKGLAVAALQVAATTADSWQAWQSSSPVPFPVGRVAEKSAGNQWATGVESLPWLILVDAKGTVVAEGFALEELDAKLSALKK